MNGWEWVACALLRSFWRVGRLECECVDVAGESDGEDGGNGESLSAGAGVACCHEMFRRHGLVVQIISDDL